MESFLGRARQLSKAVQRWLNHYFVTKAPYQIPPRAKGLIVTYGPWIDLVILVLLAPALLVLLGVGTFFLPLSVVGGYQLTFGILLAFIVLVIQLVLMIAAL